MGEAARVDAVVIVLVEEDGLVSRGPDVSAECRAAVDFKGLACDPAALVGHQAQSGVGDIQALRRACALA